MDIPGWNDGVGYTCAEFSANGWCAGGAVVSPGYLGASSNFPEQNCCNCGGGSTPAMATGNSPPPSRSLQLPRHNYITVDSVGVVTYLAPGGCDHHIELLVANDFSEYQAMGSNLATALDHALLIANNGEQQLLLQSLALCLSVAPGLHAWLPMGHRAYEICPLPVLVILTMARWCGFVHAGTCNAV